MPLLDLQPFRTMSKGLPDDAVDERWLAELRERVSEHGAKAELARRVGVHPSEITHLCTGKRTPVRLVIRVSRELGMLLPPSWFEPDEYAWLQELSRLKRRGMDAEARELTDRIRRSVEKQIAAHDVWEKTDGSEAS